MLLYLAACQEPFGADRHDLVGFRVAAVAVAPAAAGATIRPRVALIVDGRPWSDDPVSLYWHWVDGPDDVLALDADSRADSVGPAPSLVVPQDRRTLALVARLGEEEQRSFVEIAEPPATIGAVTGLTLESLPLEVSTVDGPELLLQARRELESQPADQIARGGFARLTAEVDGDPLVRWMATAGTFFELDRQTTDWAAGELRLDEDEVEDGRRVLQQGQVTFLALALGAPGETTFRATDAYVGEAPPGLRVQGRFLPTHPPVAWQPGEAVRGRLALDDTSPTGLVLTDGVAEPADTYDWGTDVLPCSVRVEGPFDPGWLLTGLCPRGAVEGFEVAVIPESTR